MEDNYLKILDKIEDSEYGIIKRCQDKSNNIVYLINDKIIEDKEIINKIGIKYGFIIPDDFINIIY